MPLTRLISKCAAFAALLVASAAPLAAQATVFSNSDTGEISTFGTPGTPYMGETFTAPGGVLDDWSFDAESGRAGNIVLEIATWTGSSLGTVLYTSSDLSYSGGAGTIAFSDIGLSLTTGDDYIAFITTHAVTDPAAVVVINTSTGNGGLGGGMRYSNSTSGTPEWSSNTVSMQFSATFDADASASDSDTSASVPEPGIAGLLTGSLLLLGALRRRQSRITCN